MEITQQQIEAIKVACENTKKVFDALFGKDTRPITERVKTFDDACEVLGATHPLVEAFNEYMDKVITSYEARKKNADVVAYMALRVITAALNEGWEPSFEEGETRWYPWYSLKDGEVACAYCSDDSLVTSAGHGSRLAFKSEELAQYAAEQFKDIYCEFLGIKEGGEK